MAFDFRRLMTPEQRERYDAHELYAAEQRQRAVKMDNDTLANTIEYFMTQSAIPRTWIATDPVYDAQLFHVLLPEMVKRLRGLKP